MKKTILFLFILFNTSFLFSQSKTYSDIRQVRLNNVDAIIENKQVVGYYVFYFKDKVNKKESAYELQLLDVNLTPTHTIEFIKPKNSFLLEACYNGSAFCFSFLNIKEKTVEYQVIDKKANIVGTYTENELSSAEMESYMQAVQSEDDVYSGGLISVEGKGFVRYGMDKADVKGSRYKIELIDNNAKKTWSAGSGAPKEKKSYESAQSFYADQSAIVSLISMREKNISSDMDTYLLFTDPSSGKDMFKVSTDHSKGFLIAMGISYDANAKSYIVYGEYYGKRGEKEKFDPSNKLGFFMLNIDATGKVIEEHFVDWNLDIAKLIPLNKKGRMEGNLSVFIHNLVKTADGKYFIIGEQFKKSASALGMVSVMSSNSNVGTVRADLHDMVVFEFNSSFTPVKMYVVEKDMTKVLLPKGASFLPMSSLGQYLKAIRAFDYSFTFVSDGTKTFQSSYVNYDKEKGEKNKYVVGSIVYNKQGEIVTDEIPLTSKPTFFSVLPGKPGYVLIFEYFKKKKEMIVRLEKMDI